MRTLELLRSLETSMGAEAAQSLVEFVDSRIKEEIGNNTATRNDLANLKTELIKEMKTDKVDLIKWMFIFWVGQIAIIMALFKFFMK